MEKTNPIVNLFRYTWRYSEGNKVMVVVFILLSFLANFVQLFEPVVVSRAFNAVQFNPGDPNLLRNVIYNLSLVVLITLLFWAMHGTSRVIELKNGFFVRKKYKLQMFGKILALPTSWHKDHHSGDTIDKINKASEGLYEFSRLIFVIVTNVVRLGGGIVALWIFYPPASIMAILIAVATFTLIAKFDNRLRLGYKKIFSSENSLASAIHDYISNIITIITLRLKGRVTSEIEHRSMLAYPAYSKNAVIGEIKWFFASFLLSLMISSVLILNAYQSYTATGIIVLGTLFALYQYLRRIGDTFFEFALRYSDMIRQDAAIRAAEVINDDFAKVPIKEAVYLPVNWGTIEIKNLSFMYQSDDNPEHKRVHLSNVNFKIERGQRIALIGESGSGKSTLLALLRGLYTPIKASLDIDGKRMKHGLSHLYEHVTLIPQDPEIFNSTVEDNITMETRVEEKELEDAIELAQFKSTLQRLPNGLKTNVLEKGVSLSGGEKQRLALARGILAARNSEFLFMDEPTSSVDTQNELLIYEKIFTAFPDKTIISTVHRLHLLKMFDLIYYFKEGKIKASGSFEKLLLDPEIKTLLEKYSVISSQPVK